MRAGIERERERARGKELRCPGPDIFHSNLTWVSENHSANKQVKKNKQVDRGGQSYFKK
jgi:hypothetical protein